MSSPRRRRRLIPTLTLAPLDVDILLLVEDGLSNAEIAARLGVSRHTVRNRLGGIFAILHARTRGHAVTIARRRDLLPDATPDPAP